MPVKKNLTFFFVIITLYSQLDIFMALLYKYLFHIDLNENENKIIIIVHSYYVLLVQGL